MLFIITLLVIFIFFLGQSLYNLEIKTFALKGFLRYFAYVSYVILILSFNPENLKLFFKYAALIVIASSLLFLKDLTSSERYHSFFSHPNNFAYTTMVILYFVVIHKPFNPRIRYLLLALLFYILLRTETSGAVIALGLVLAYNFLINRKIRLKTKLLSFLILGLVVPFGFLYSNRLTEQIASIEYLDKRFIMPRVRDFRGGGGYGSFVWRVIYWLKIYFTFLRETLFVNLFGLYVDTMTKGNFPYKFIYKDPHNDFIKILIEFGFVGIVFFFNFLKNLFIVLNKKGSLLILLLIPLFFDNMIVNFSIMTSFLTLFVYEYKLQA